VKVSPQRCGSMISIWVYFHVQSQQAPYTRARGPAAIHLLVKTVVKSMVNK
jgi:hypothetical protein